MFPVRFVFLNCSGGSIANNLHCADGYFIGSSVSEALLTRYDTNRLNISQQRRCVSVEQPLQHRGLNTDLTS